VNERRELGRLLRWQLDNRGVGYCSDGKLKYNVTGCRMSGDMNTALGNCLLMCAMVWAYAQHVGVSCSLANNGDDCVVIMESSQLDQFNFGLCSWFHDMGFTMKVEDPVYDFERIEFCQTQPIFDGEVWTMVRGIKAFQKDCMSLFLFNSDGAMKKWYKAVSDGGLALAGGIPCWGEFYLAYQRISDSLPGKIKSARHTKYGILDQPAFETGMMILAQGMSRVSKVVTPYARYSYWLAFGISPDLQVAIEAQYRLLSSFDGGVSERDPVLPMRGWAVI